MGSKADISGSLVKLLQSFKEWNKRQEDHIRNTKANGFYNPPVTGWDGDLFDIEGMAEPFKRDELYEMFKDTLANPEDLGVTGDLELILIQGDMLGAAERAYRNRHASPVRNRLHAAGRHRGHGHDNGVIEFGLLAFVHQLNNLAKAQG